MNKNLIILIVIAVLLFGIAAYYFLQQFSLGGSEENETIFCAQDVQECSNGSFVGRNPNNNCEFYDCPQESGASGTFPEGTPIQTHEINIQNFAFSPKELTIQVGDTVVWTNFDSSSHTVTSTSGTELDSERLSKNEVYSHTFESVGAFDYYCTIHPSMKGVIIVE